MLSTIHVFLQSHFIMLLVQVRTVILSITLVLSFLTALIIFKSNSEYGQFISTHSGTAEETLPHSGLDTKHIYLVNSDPETVGKRRLKIKRFNNDLKKGRMRKYNIDYFMKSKSK